MAKPKPIHLFIDESGDPTFYGNRKKLLVGENGFQPYLIIGIVETLNRKTLGEAVLNFLNHIKSDVLYNTISSVKREGWYPHARAGHPEIRAKFFELIRNLGGYKAHVMIARKDLHIFEKKHNSNSTEFYFDVLHQLLSRILKDTDYQYHLYLSTRRRSTLKKFQEAVTRSLTPGVKDFRKTIYNLQIVSGKEMPELSIVDYLLWAVQRRLLTGEHRHFDAVKDKFATIANLYDDGEN